MNVVLETLYLRRPRIEYVSPPVCPIVFSASGVATFDQCFNDLVFCSAQKINTNFLNFQEPPDGYAYNVYYSTQETGQPFQLVNDGLRPGQSVVFTAGVYYFTVNTAAGESLAFPTTTVPGGIYVTLQMPNPANAVSWNLYKDGVKIISAFTGAVVESSAQGWYQATKITADGETPLSGCSALLLSGTIPAPPPPPPPGPNWCFDPAFFDTPWASRQGDSGGTFPPVFNVYGGFINAGGLCFNGGVFMVSGNFFNYAFTDGQRIMSYVGPAANCRATVTVVNVGPEVNLGITFKVRGIVVFATPGQGALTDIPKSSGTTVVNFSIPAGTSDLNLELAGSATFPPGNGTSIVITFQNL